MKVQDIIDLASVSELANTSYKDNIKTILIFMNMGMLSLYTKFPILTKEYLVELTAGVTEYPLPDDFISVHQVYGEVDEGMEDTLNVLSINDANDPYSVFFPGGGVVQIPETENGSFVSIIYQAYPKRITEDDLDTRIELPAGLYDALSTYIGYRGALGTGSGAEREDMVYWNRYENLCSRALNNGTTHTPVALSTIPKFHKKGLV